MEKEDNKVRLDKWLWAVRQFKTRSIATTACDQGKISINDQPAKASRIVKIGDIVSVKRTGLTRTLKVLQITTNRMAAKLVPEFYEELTPLADIEAFNLEFRELVSTVIRVPVDQLSMKDVLSTITSIFKGFYSLFTDNLFGILLIFPRKKRS